MGKLLRWLAVPVLAASAVGLTGCGSIIGEPAETEVTDLPEAEAAVTEELTEEPTEEPTEEFTLPNPKVLFPHPKPEFPLNAHNRTKSGAVAFVEYFWRSVGYSMSMRDKTLFETLCSDSAALCQYYSEVIDELVATDSYYQNMAVEYLRTWGTIPPDGGPLVEQSLEIEVCFSDYTLWTERGTKSETVGKGCLISHMHLYWDEGWKVDAAFVGEA